MLLAPLPQGRTKGGGKAIIVSVKRLFHEAQNALLKLFEEPPEGTLLILVVPSSGILLSTLRSRLRELPEDPRRTRYGADNTSVFLQAEKTEREKIFAKLIEQSRSDDADKKQTARTEALRLAEGLACAAHDAWRKKGDDDLRLFLHDLDRFIPILNDRAAPLKPILEHIGLTLARSLQGK